MPHIQIFFMFTYVRNEHSARQFFSLQTIPQHYRNNISAENYIIEKLYCYYRKIWKIITEIWVIITKIHYCPTNFQISCNRQSLHNITFHRQLFTDTFILPTVYFTEAHFTDKVILVIVVRVRVELGRIRAKVRVLFEKKLVGEMNFGETNCR